ncbi:Protein CBG27980 [Caenorhabditis briggsae]|uniref:Uncharacterized protein n=2 Tax=Caenorhabditis briggsae TaxID=6238 RepID=A0AAE9A063_CAEBR|nr:Protein CBG27980 [Caenorhabditis briggsae]ULT83885.1 hypothetical protein L3Y34_012882 [Caenorhabditis briggsae]CAS00152.1 Protein CBG27980 [Caenorhabditis briggsae]
MRMLKNYYFQKNNLILFQTSLPTSHQRHSVSNDTAEVQCGSVVHQWREDLPNHQDRQIHMKRLSKLLGRKMTHFVETLSVRNLDVIRGLPWQGPSKWLRFEG